MNKCLCGCVILNYNDAETTIRLVNRIREFNTIDFIVVVDNCSTDNSYEKLCQLQTFKIRVLKNKKNNGYGGGNNIGVEYAYRTLRCEYVLITNPDVIFTNRTIERMLFCINGDSLIAVVSPIQLNNKRERIREIAWKIPTISQYIFSAEIFIGKYTRQFYYDNFSEFIQEEIEVDCVPGAFLLVRAQPFISIGGYDQEMFLYCEETVLGIKLKEQGYKTILMLSENYIHEHSVSINRSIRKISLQKKMLLKSRYFILKKYMNANLFELFIAKIWYKLAELECMLLENVRKFIGNK